jgi:thiol-disulfide isomerase/thioredoxin
LTTQTALTTPAAQSYLAGWAALTRLMDAGASWSGRERNCVYLNLEGKAFANVSAAFGLDFVDDGRAVAAGDWDLDGDLDLWLRNRTGPQLRVMLNESATENNHVSLRLEGVDCNRDAIGARVVVRTDRHTHTRELRAGDGYLAQSSKWLHFGLGPAAEIRAAHVEWPGGPRQTLDGLKPNTRYLVQQGAAPRRVPTESIKLPARAAETPTNDTAPTRIVLKTPLPLPPSLTEWLDSNGFAGQPVLVNLWAQWCAPCLAELSEFSTGIERIRAAKLSLLAANLDEPARRPLAKAAFARQVAPAARDRGLKLATLAPAQLDTLDVLLTHVRHKQRELALPTSLLIDEYGQLQIIYEGPLDIPLLLCDAADYVTTTRPANQRSSFPGRWYFRGKRDWSGLAQSLKERNRTRDARFYLKKTLPRFQSPGS